MLRYQASCSPQWWRVRRFSCCQTLYRWRRFLNLSSFLCLLSSCVFCSSSAAALTLHKWPLLQQLYLLKINLFYLIWLISQWSWSFGLDLNDVTSAQPDSAPPLLHKRLVATRCCNFPPGSACDFSSVSYRIRILRVGIRQRFLFLLMVMDVERSTDMSSIGLDCELLFLFAENDWD